MKRRVVITGIGIWSCLGNNLDEVRDSLFNGKSGIGLEEARLSYGYSSALTGIVDKPHLKGLISRRQRECLSEEAAYAYMSSKEAFENAAIDDAYMKDNEIGIIFGNDSSAMPVIEASQMMESNHDSQMIGSGLVFKSMNSTVTMNLSSIFHLQGINFTVSAACASGSHSIGLGYLMIKNGLQDIVLCGGAQETNYYSMTTFDAIGAFSKRMGEPAKASRPFDRSRDGLVPSGGSASVILEEYEHAVRRGAEIWAEVCGYGFSSNGGGISKPSDKGCEIAMSRAMKDANVRACDVDYVHAHATSTPQGDMLEAIAIDKLFSGTNVPVSSTKSMTGHECWMAGASGIVYCVLMMKNNFVAPNINYENPDEYSAKLNITPVTIEKRMNVILSNSFGFGGTNSALVIKRVE